MDLESWRNWWLEKSPTYFTDKIWSFSRPDLIPRLKVGPHTPVLEIGFGYGRELAQWSNLTDRVYGVELSEYTKNLALKGLDQRKVSPLPQLSTYDGVTLPYPDSMFGVVYSCFVMQHLSKAHAERLMLESTRVLEPGGLALHEFFGDPQFRSPSGDCFSGDPEAGGMYNNAYTCEEIQTLAARCGQVEWVESWPITKEWSNWFVCVGKGGE